VCTQELRRTFTIRAAGLTHLGEEIGHALWVVTSGSQCPDTDPVRFDFIMPGEIDLGLGRCCLCTHDCTGDDLTIATTGKDQTHHGQHGDNIHGLAFFKGPVHMKLGDVGDFM